MKKPVLFTQRVEVIESYNERRDCADQRIVEFIGFSGFLPIPVPNNPEFVKRMMKDFDIAGMILTGGNSLTKYGGNAPERDETEKIMLDHAIEQKIPTYGFCRGMQMILDYFGNELTNVSGHVAVRHMVMGAEEKTEVNSYHNQGCVRLKSEELIVTMKSDDGVIEKVKHRFLPIIGTMWHPEREDPFKLSDVELVRALFNGEEK